MKKRGLLIAVLLAVLMFWRERDHSKTIQTGIERNQALSDSYFKALGENNKIIKECELTIQNHIKHNTDVLKKNNDSNDRMIDMLKEVIILLKRTNGSRR